MSDIERKAIFCCEIPIIRDIVATIIANNSNNNVPEFKQVGKNNYIQYYNEKLDLAHKLGYPNVASSFVGEYLKHRSASKAAEVLKVSTSCVIHRLHQIPGFKVAPRGGNNHPKIRYAKLRIGRCPVLRCNGDRGRKTKLQKQPDGKLKCPKCGGIWDDPSEDKK
jgi:hypothetical protein